MIFIIEGCDKSGKTTLINDLNENLLKIPIVFKLSQKPKDKSKKEQEKIKIIYTELFEQAKRLSDLGKVVLFDRAYPSEMVYSIKRHYDAMKLQDWWTFDFELSKRNDLYLLYCSVPEDILQIRFEREKEEFLNADEIGKIKKRYEDFLTRTQLKYLILDTTKDRMKNLLSIKELVLKNEHPRREN